MIDARGSGLPSGNGWTMRHQPSYRTASQSTPYPWMLGSCTNMSLMLESKMTGWSPTSTKSLDPHKGLISLMGIWKPNKLKVRPVQITMSSTNMLRFTQPMPMYAPVSCGSGARKDQMSYCWIWGRPIYSCGQLNFMAVSDGGVSWQKVLSDKTGFRLECCAINHEDHC